MIKNIQESGKLGEDHITDALALYQSDCGQAFKEISSYNIVKHTPKWQENPFFLEHCGASQHKAQNSDAYQTDIDVGSNVDSLPKMDRPTGSKRAKRGRSGLAEEFMLQNLENSKAVATATLDVAKQGQDAQSMLKEMLEFTILSTKTSDLDETARAKIEARQSHIIA
ncbi:hypothetical protein DFH28DRAFT_893795 [Melampsora americana]|nr:hypothetical protein DFH28DRAFT_893795 [Melampsora americana]